MYCFKTCIGSSTCSCTAQHLWTCTSMEHLYMQVLLSLPVNYFFGRRKFYAGVHITTSFLTNVKLYNVNSFVWLLLHAGPCEPCCSSYISEKVPASHEVTAKSIETTSTRQANKVKTIHPCSYVYVHSCTCSWLIENWRSLYNACAYRCKLINVRRFVCDWTRYEQDIQELRTILESQVANSSLYISGGQLLCHTPGNLLHFPLPLHIVSTLVPFLFFLSSPSLPTCSSSPSSICSSLFSSFFNDKEHCYINILTRSILTSNMFLQHREVSRITSERDSAAVVHLRKSIQTRLSKKLGGYRRTSTLRVGFVSFDYKNHPVSSYTFTMSIVDLLSWQ